MSGNLAFSPDGCGSAILNGEYSLSPRYGVEVAEHLPEFKERWKV
jgi:hypothetical protein